MDVPLRALNRFGLGARPGERQRISDARGWLKAQLDGGPPALRTPEATSPAAIGDAVRGLRMPGQRDEQERREARRRLVDLGASRSAHRARRRASTSDRPFVERLVAFWSNHLCVSAGAKVLVAPLAGTLRTRRHPPARAGTIRGHGARVGEAPGHARVPGQLPVDRTLVARRRAPVSGEAEQRRGLNENYARELLELHTLGVNGGYTQQDVQELARILTGWTIEGIGGPGASAPTASGGARQRRGSPGAACARQSDRLRVPGSCCTSRERRRCSTSATSEDGVAEGERAIRALCRHPSTARFVATKLVAHFVSDDPPAAARSIASRVRSARATAT